MSSGAREQLRYQAETVIGTTNTPFAAKTLRFTDTSLDLTVNKTESTEKLSSRLAQGMIPTSIDVAGDITGELSFGTYDDFFASAFMNDWEVDSPVIGSQSLEIGIIRKTFSIERANTDVNTFLKLAGCYVNTLSISIPEDGIITTTMGIMGTSGVASTTTSTGSIAAATTTDKMSNIGVGDILVSGASLAGVACITAFEFNLDNGAQRQRCLGSGLSTGKVIETMATVTGSFTVAWSQKAMELYQKRVTNESISLKVPITDSAGNKYTIIVPDAEINGSWPSGGNGDLLNTTFEYTARLTSPSIERDAA